MWHRTAHETYNSSRLKRLPKQRPWCNLQTRSDNTLDVLHYTIQIAFGRTNTHLSVPPLIRRRNLWQQFLEHAELKIVVLRGSSVRISKQATKEYLLLDYNTVKSVIQQ